MSDPTPDNGNQDHFEASKAHARAAAAEMRDAATEAAREFRERAGGVAGEWQEKARSVYGYTAHHLVNLNKAGR